MSPKLLLVNDLPDALDDFERIARAAGFEDIRRAEGSPRAFQLIESNQFDVAVIDLNLDTSRPESSEGLEVIERLSRDQPDCHIMAYTAHFGKQGVPYGIKAIGAGATDFICEQWFDINHEELLRLKLKIWFGYLTDVNAAAKPVLASV